MRARATPITLSLLLIASAVGCAGIQDPVRSPRIVAQLEHLPKDEEATLRQELAKLGGTPLKGGKIELPARLPEVFEIGEACRELEAWHKQVLEIRNEAGATIAHATGIDITLRYSSPRADTVAVAVIRIKPQPAGATLFIDSELPELDGHKSADGSAILNYPEKKPDSLRINVPFSYIRNNSIIYFHTVLHGARAYFEYDLDTQTQRQIPDVSSDDEWLRRAR